jgi:hypothetical protein
MESRKTYLDVRQLGYCTTRNFGPKRVGLLNLDIRESDYCKTRKFRLKSRTRKLTCKADGLLHKRKCTSKRVGRLQDERICAVLLALLVLLKEKRKNVMEMWLL